MRVLIVGSGAIGALIGGALSRSGMDVVFFDLPAVVEKVKETGIQVGGLNDKITLTDVQAVSEIAPDDHFDLAVVAVKGFSTRASVEKLPAEAIARVITFQNGIGNEEVLAEKFLEEKIIAGSITYPVAYPEPGHVVIENIDGGLGISPMKAGEDVDEVAKVFRDAGFNVEVVADYRGLKWSKLLLNLICNASCAVLGMGPDEIFADRRLVSIEREQILEALRVMKKKGIPVVDLPGYPVKRMALVYELCPPSVLKLVMRNRVARARGEKKPSLLLEMERASTNTEVTFMNGAVYHCSCGVSLHAPVNKILCETLEDIACGNILWEDFRERPEAFINLFK